ncbi:MAG: hypothetical protein P9M06_03175 [Candidatus Saelkia tenebricola]|nr:hypothetical protein [Candidatus Saelkia tenebricola]
MEVKLEQLIETIKKDGVIEAQKQSGEIIEKATKEAALILKETKEKAGRIIRDAQEKAEDFRKTAEKSMQLASRDVILSLKEKIHAIFDILLREKITEELKQDYLKDLILKVIENWSPDGNNSWQVLVNDEDKEKLKFFLLKSFKEQARGEIEIKTTSDVKQGFRLGLKDEEIYYDFSDESIAEALSLFVNPLIADLMKENVSGG